MKKCTSCGEFHDDLGYTEIDGQVLCDDCLEEYEYEKKKKYFHNSP